MSPVEPFPSQLSLRRYGASPGSHSHAHFQVLWGWRGALELEIEGRGARMTAGRVAVIPPGARHDFWAGHPRGAQCAVLDSADARLEPLAGRVLAAPPGLQGLFDFLREQPDAALQASAVPLVQRTLWLMQPPPACALPRAREIDWPALQRWVDARLDQPLEVAHLAERAHLSASQFAARCVAHWGLPPLAWLRERRLARARRLRTLGLPVAEVAARCGYRSPSALTAALRRSGEGG
jgi:AraC-like DNA-binding protein